MGLAWSVRRIGALECDSVWATKELALRRAERMKEDTEVSVVVVGKIEFYGDRFVLEGKAE